MDLNKEIKLSELFRRKPKQPKGAKAPLWKRELRLRKTAAQRRLAAPQKARQLVGLKIGGSQLSAARIRNNGHAEVVQLARAPLAHGVVVGGEVRDPDALAAALRDFFRKHRLPRRGIRLGISNNRIGVRTFEIAGIDDPQQLANAIRFRAQDALPIAIDEAVLDYRVLEEREGPDGETVRRILLVVAHRALVDGYVAACRKAGIRLAGIDLEAFGLLRALGVASPDLLANPDAALVVVSLGYDRSNLAVSHGEVCEFTRALDWGGFQLDTAIGRALDLTPFEAEPIKRALSLEDATAVPEGLTAEEATRAREALRRALESFARDLVSSLAFYQNQPGSLGLGEVVLTGGTAQLPGLAAELQRLTGVRVRVGDPLVRVKLGRRVREPEQLGSLASAIGLGMDV